MCTKSRILKKLPQTLQLLKLFSEVHTRLKPVDSFQCYETTRDFILKLGFDSV